MVKLLAQHGASYSSTNKYDLTPMDIARQFGRTDILKLSQDFIKT